MNWVEIFFTILFSLAAASVLWEEVQKWPSTQRWLAHRAERRRLIDAALAEGAAAQKAAELATARAGLADALQHVDQADSVESALKDVRVALAALKRAHRLRP